MIIKYKYILNENEKEINIKQFLINKKKKRFPAQVRILPTTSAVSSFNQKRQIFDRKT